MRAKCNWSERKKKPFSGASSGTTVTVVHRGAGFTRGKSRNIDEVKRMHAASRLKLHFEAAITAIDPDVATLSARSGSVTVPYDVVFVMIGSIPPWDTLKAAGISRERTDPSGQGEAPAPG
jgi:thioredoxin reductase